MMIHDPFRQQAVQWARDLLQAPFVVLDTETTGLSNRDEIVSVAIIDPRGETLLDTLVKPTQPIPWGATRIHGITDAHVADAPMFPDVYPLIADALAGRALAVFNLDFDLRMLDANRARYSLPPLDYESGHCAMKWYAKFYGQRQSWQRGFKWQSLSAACGYFGIATHGAHSAAADCRMTLEVIRRIAACD